MSKLLNKRVIATEARIVSQTTGVASRFVGFLWMVHAPLFVQRVGCKSVTAAGPVSLCYREMLRKGRSPFSVTDSPLLGEGAGGEG